MEKSNSQFSIFNSKLKNILWDFDGVIFDSMHIKGAGFKELFKGYNPEYIEELLNYHFENGGISRFEKIKYFYEKILNKKIGKDKIKKLANKFSEIIKDKLYNKNNLIKDSITFIKNNYKNFNFHIVSGAEHNELNNLCEFLGINEYFITINGSPTKKSVIIKNIFKKYNYKRDEIIFIGDSITDYNVSKKCGISFFGYNNGELKKIGNYIECFKDFDF